MQYLTYLKLTPVQVDDETLGISLWPPSPLPGVPEPPSVDAIGSGLVTILLDDAPGQQACTATATAIAMPNAQAAPAAADGQAATAVAAAAPGSTRAPAVAATGSQSGTGAAALRAPLRSHTSRAAAIAAEAAAGAAIGQVGAGALASPDNYEKAARAAGAVAEAAAVMMSEWSVLGAFLPQLRMFQYCPAQPLRLGYNVLTVPKRFSMLFNPEANHALAEVSLTVTVPREATWLAAEAQAAFDITYGYHTAKSAAASAATQAAMAAADAAHLQQGSSRGLLHQQQQQRQQRTQSRVQVLWPTASQRNCRLGFRDRWGGITQLKGLKKCLIPYHNWRLVHMWQVMCICHNRQATICSS